MFKNAKHIFAMMMFLVFIVTAGCDQQELAKGQLEPGSQAVVSPGESGADQGKKATDRQQMIKVYFANEDGTKLIAKAKPAVKSDKDKYTEAMEVLIAGTKEKGMIAMVPPKTQLRGVEVKNGIAYVDFNSDLVKRFNGGSTGEIMLVGSIVNTLTEFPEVKAVQILIEGKQIETISGHMDISEPLQRFKDILKN